MGGIYMSKLQNWLQNKGIVAENITLNYTTGSKKALFIDTDYAGPYPGKKQFELLNIIRSQVKRYYSDKFTFEARGCYTGIFIIEK